jgi:Tfp pilus assembly protein PilX
LIPRRDKGFSIIGTLFTLIVLGVLGAALVALVSMEQESRMRSIHRERMFYAVQAGFEFALREIKEGGYPIVSNKPLGDASFTTAIDASQRKITATGVSSASQRIHSITTDHLAKDCATINLNGATVGGPNQDVLQNVTITKTCLNAINIDMLKLSWTPNNGERVREVQIGGVQVYSDANGTPSGEYTNISDTRTTGTATINSITFSSPINGKTMNLTCKFTDSSEVTASRALP